MRILCAIALCLLTLLQASAYASAQRVDEWTKRALQLDAHPEHGAAVFERTCAQCHGRGAQGDSARAIPALAGQRFNYIVRQLANFSGKERDSSTMQSVLNHVGLHRPQTWVDLAAYLNRLSYTGKPATGDGKYVALGRGIVHEQCASCHKADASGDDGGFVPSLRNQNYAYLKAQLAKLARGSRHNVDEDLVRFWASLDARDRDGTADYLSRLTGKGDVGETMRSDGTVVD